MKKSLFSLILALTALFTSGATASADEPVYSRILAEDIVIYMDASLTMPWFVLPYSYYVKVLSSDARSVKVEYKGGDPLRPAVKGYIRASDLSVTDETPAAPYPNSSFTVGQSCLLYKDANFLYFETVTENSTFDFYGYITRPGDEIYLFGYTVTASGDKYIGFIPKTALLN
ncbi:MAG: hypothetical protein IJS67_00305, partial [Clostridia bacterium]|nr:hypothetical protein [Clostridia bacterium]